MEEDLKRAYEAYFKSREGLGSTNQPNAGMSEIEDIEGNSYAVLRNVNGILAVFNIPKNLSLELVELEEENWPESLKEE